MLIGLDIGTTNVKAVAMNDTGEVPAAAERPNRTLTPQPGWSEQEPEAVFQNVLQVLRAVIPDNSTGSDSLKGIVFSAAMHALVAVDAAGQPLTNFLLWSDLRSDAIAQRLRQESAGMEIYRRTGVPIHAMSPLCKLIWLRENRPDIFEKTHKFLGIKEFVWHRMTGEYHSDLSVASATGLLNIWNNDWDEAALALAGISRDRLPELVPPFFISRFSGISPYSENALVHIPLVIGASDGALANIGSGATAKGEVAVTIGTSAAIRTISHEPVVDAQMRTFCYRVDETRCILGGASNNGTNALEWLRTDVFRSVFGADQFAGQASGVPPGSDGLIFLPYLSGERAPLYLASATGSFCGLTGRHTQAHFVRAVMEGILFNLKIIAGALEAHEPIQVLYASGGFSYNMHWVQMLADIFQKPVVLRTGKTDASVLGAVSIGLAALDLGQTIEDQKVNTIYPNMENAGVYQAAFQKFATLASEFSSGQF